MHTADGGAEAAELTKALAALAEQSQRVAQRFFEKQSQGDGFQIPDPGVVADAFVKLSQAMLADPARLMQAQMQLWQQMAQLWQHELRKAAGQADGAADRAGPGRQAVQGRGLERAARVRLCEAVLPAGFALDPGHRGRGRIPGPADQGQGRVLHAPVRGCAVADQFRAHQPHRAQARRRHQGGEPAQGPAKSVRRSRAGQGRPQDLDDQRGGLQGRREYRRLAGQGGLPDRADAADPVRTDHGAGPQAALAAGAAVDQQVLHPGPQAEEQLHQVRRRPGLHGVRHFLGQSRAGPGPQDVRALSGRGAAGGPGCDRAGDSASAT